MQRPQLMSQVPGPKKLCTEGAEQSGWKPTCAPRPSEHLRFRVFGVQRMPQVPGPRKLCADGAEQVRVEADLRPQTQQTYRV